MMRQYWYFPGGRIECNGSRHNQICWYLNMWLIENTLWPFVFSAQRLSFGILSICSRKVIATCRADDQTCHSLFALTWKSVSTSSHHWGSIERKIAFARSLLLTYMLWSCHMEVKKQKGFELLHIFPNQGQQLESTDYFLMRIRRWAT